jgi:hypothetical protein
MSVIFVDSNGNIIKKALTEIQTEMSPLIDSENGKRKHKKADKQKKDDAITIIAADTNKKEDLPEHNTDSNSLPLRDEVLADSKEKVANETLETFVRSVLTEPSVPIHPNGNDVVIIGGSCDKTPDGTITLDLSKGILIDEINALKRENSEMKREHREASNEMRRTVDILNTLMNDIKLQLQTLELKFATFQKDDGDKVSYCKVNDKNCGTVKIIDGKLLITLNLKEEGDIYLFEKEFAKLDTEIKPTLQLESGEITGTFLEKDNKYFLSFPKLENYANELIEFSMPVDVALSESK